MTPAVRNVVLLGGRYRYPRPAGANIVLIGDSLFQQNKLSVTGATQLDAMGRGDIYWLLGANRNFQHANYMDNTNYWNADVNAVTRRGFTNGANYAIGGSSSWGTAASDGGIDGLGSDQGAVAEMGRPFASPTKPDIVFINYGANDLNAARTGANLVANLKVLAAYVIGQGRKPVIMTVMARDTTGGSGWAIDDAKRQQWGLANADITGGTWCGAGMAIEMCDVNQYVADTGVTDNFGYHSVPLANMTGDSLHPAVLGGYYRAKAMQAVLDRLVRPGNIWPTSPTDSLNLWNAQGYNSSFSGTSGQKSGVNVTGTIVGTGGAQYALIRGGSSPTGGTTNVTFAGSVQALANGNTAQRVTITPGGTNDYEGVVFEKYNAGALHALPAGLSSGDYCRFLLDVTCSAWDGWRSISTEFAFYNASNSKLLSCRAMGSSNATTDRFPTEAFTRTIMTERMKVPALATQCSMIMTLIAANGGTGTATIDISNPQLIKEADPTAIWTAG